jgi:signal transduction histidine kinase
MGFRMNNRILIQVAAPTVFIGLLLCGACLLSAWYVNRLQTNLATILSHNVSSLQVAKQLEINVRRLRFHCFLYLNAPDPSLLETIHADHGRFEEHLGRAKDMANTPKEHACIRAIEQGYNRYLSEFERMGEEARRYGPQQKFRKLADSHPLRHVLDPCEEYFQINEKLMADAVEESNRVSERLHLTMLLFGLGGPLGGLLSGYGIARGLSRSIHRLSVQVQGMAQTLDQDVGSVKLTPGGDIHQLDQQIQHVVGRVAEVAERLQRHQREMLRAEQLSAVGQLAAGMAHEVRNPLTSIKMLVEAGLRTQKPKPFTLENLQVIHAEIVRLERTVQGFLDFARPSALQRAQCDLREVVTQGVELVRLRARQQKVEIKLACTDQPVPVHLDRVQFCTVLVNLLINALDAMPQGGRLAVSLRKSRETGIELEVADTGPGISPEIAGRLFTPFSSTKPTGSGLGLSISRRVVEEHGGTVTAANRTEGGACFSIILPNGDPHGSQHLNGVKESSPGHRPGNPGEIPCPRS